MNAAIGNHSKITARPADQARIRSFFRDVLGATLTRQTAGADFIKLDGGFFVAVLYSEDAPDPRELQKSIWLELCSEHPDRLRSRILDFGVTRLEVPSTDHLYFQAPGGQVFRLVRSGEDLSRFEK